MHVKTVSIPIMKSVRKNITDQKLEPSNKVIITGYAIKAKSLPLQGMSWIGIFKVLDTYPNKAKMTQDARIEVRKFMTGIQMLDWTIFPPGLADEK
jgi:hypothetical protein